MTFVVAALYQFTDLPDYGALQGPLLSVCDTHGLKGTLLLAGEGINGTVAGTRSGIDALRAFLAADGRFDRLEYKESHADKMPFYRMKVRLKKEIVTLRAGDVNPNRTVGTYVDSAQWNQLLADPDVTVIDVRNDYEVRIGTFPGALDPKTKTFTEFPQFVEQNLSPATHKKIAMVCTGGIRCEKASSYMKQQGFDEVYHLKGGILKYLETVTADDNQFAGECFVFDQRVTIGHGLALGHYTLCYTCRAPLSPDDMASPHFRAGEVCPHCVEHVSDAQIRRSRARNEQILLCKMKGLDHVGAKMPKRLGAETV